MIIFKCSAIYFMIFQSKLAGFFFFTQKPVHVSLCANFCLRNRHNLSGMLPAALLFRGEHLFNDNFSTENGKRV